VGIVPLLKADYGQPYDQFYNSTVLIANFNGSDAATSSNDASPSAHTLTFNDNAQLDDAEKRFGATSLLLDGTNDNVSASDSADWLFTDEFTVEGWFYLNALTQDSVIVSQYNSGTNRRSWALQVNNTGDKLRFLYSFNGSTAQTGLEQVTGTVSTGAWHHAACDRDANDLARLYLDGVEVDSISMPGSLHDSNELMMIGALNGGGTNELNGWIDSVRITKGVARYQGIRFNPPRFEFPENG
jgi:hypothetical protein